MHEKHIDQLFPKRGDHNAKQDWKSTRKKKEKKQDSTRNAP